MPAITITITVITTLTHVEASVAHEKAKRAQCAKRLTKQKHISIFIFLSGVCMLQSNATLSSQSLVVAVCCCSCFPRRCVGWNNILQISSSLEDKKRDTQAFLNKFYNTFEEPPQWLERAAADPPGTAPTS